MDLNTLTNRATIRQTSPTGGNELGDDDMKSALKAFHDQLLADSMGNFDLYGLLRSRAEPVERV